MQSKILDTRALACAPVEGSQIRARRMEIEWPGFSYQPGQYVMAAGQGQGMNWPTPLMIQEKTALGFTVILLPSSPLYGTQQGANLTVWGPCGTALSLQGKVALAADAPGSVLLAPYARAFAGRVSLLQIGEISGLSDPEVRAIPLDTPTDIVSRAEVQEASALMVALPLSGIAQLHKALPPEIAERTYVFVGARVGCGVGACKGCFIAGGGASYGIAVCKKGPFLPIGEVDYPRDQDSLMHYL